MADQPEDVATAYHEAGHAVVALALGRSVQRVSIAPNEIRLGQCDLHSRRTGPSDEWIETEVMILLGGLAAEGRHFGEYNHDAAEHDLRDVRQIAETRIAGTKKQDRWEKRLLDRTEHLLEKPGVWEAVERIASELLRVTTISGRAARHLFDEAARKAID